MFKFLKKNLIIIFAKDNKVFDKIKKSFFYDICVVGNNLNYKNKCRFYFEKKENDNYKNLSNLLEEISFKKYKYVLVTDQDVSISKNELLNIFRIAEEYDLNICQPCVNEDNLLVDFMSKKDNSIFRIVNFLDMRCPIFNSNILDNIRHFFKDGMSGLEWVIPKFLNYEKIAIIDSVSVTYESPLGFYNDVENLKKLSEKLKSENAQPIFVEFDFLSNKNIEKDRTIEIKNKLNNKFKRPNRRENDCIKSRQFLSNRMMNFS